jgi:hypothetical protein
MAGIRFPSGQKIFLFSTASRPALGPIPPPIRGYRGIFPRRQRGRCVKLVTHLHLMPRSEIVLYLHSFIRLHCMVLNQLSTGNTSHFRRGHENLKDCYCMRAFPNLLNMFISINFKIQMVFFGVVIPYNLLGECRRFGGIYCVRIQD